MSIKFENIVTPSIEQWRAVVMGARNPLNSWDRYDSGQGCNVDFVDRICTECDRFDNEYEYGLCVNRAKKFIIGPNDYDLLKRLCKAGTDHRKFMRMLPVIVTITAPLYWWKEFDTYKVSTVANSCSTMHKIHAKEFTLEDFSYENLIGNKNLRDIFDDISLSDYECYPKDILNCWIIPSLNLCRKKYLETKDKKYWWQMIQLLPSSYNQKRTVMLNYEVLANIYKSRRNHKLDEWSIGFMDWIKTLPYSELITGENTSDDIGSKQ